MAKPPTKVPVQNPPSQQGQRRRRPGTRPVPPRPPRNPPVRRRRGGRSPGGSMPLLVAVVLLVVAVRRGGDLVSSSGGGSTTGQRQAGRRSTTRPRRASRSYGTLGPEGVPLRSAPRWPRANTGLTGAPIDGLQCNSTEQLTYHHHAHLVIFVNGQPRPIPWASAWSRPPRSSRRRRATSPPAADVPVLAARARPGRRPPHRVADTQGLRAGAVLRDLARGPVVHPDRPLQGSGDRHGRRQAVDRRSQPRSRSTSTPRSSSTWVAPIVTPPPIIWGGTGL